jgi:hypothetical protein
MLTRRPSLKIFIYFLAILTPALAPVNFTNTLPQKINLGINHLIGMFTAISLMIIFISFGLVRTFY